MVPQALVKLNIPFGEGVNDDDEDEGEKGAVPRTPRPGKSAPAGDHARWTEDYLSGYSGLSKTFLSWDLKVFTPFFVRQQGGAHAPELEMVPASPSVQSL